MDFYTQTFPIAGKVHKCDFCGKQIEKGEKYSHRTGKICGDYYDSELCLVCKSMFDRYAVEEKKDKFTSDYVTEWLYEKYCYYCEHCKNCEYCDSDVQNCPIIRNNFESEA